MSASKQKVLITGCSDGGLGAALAVAFHTAGLHVYATARNPSKMAHLRSLGIETMTLDVLSDASIAACVSQISELDILVNNAGAAYFMPISDISLDEAKKLFDLNVWSFLAMYQAFLPLLLKSKGIIVNHTSIASVVTIPFQSVYHASKAAMAMFSDSQRLELKPFGVRVVDLKSGAVISNIMENQAATAYPLPKNSIYAPYADKIDITGKRTMDNAMPADKWANQVVRNLLKESPPSTIWTNVYQAFLVRLSMLLPFGWFDGFAKSMVGLDVVEKIAQRPKSD
ncbi:hypothetical protein AAFC00_005827 [Neodothiora populina]|uniref:Uncharacterized protein n=1 Tax=Neodothiora populina TaxID=2781224 RepID=A0ABR3P694_9PEZI